MSDQQITAFIHNLEEYLNKFDEIDDYTMQTATRFLRERCNAGQLFLGMHLSETLHPLYFHSMTQSSSSTSSSGSSLSPAGVIEGTSSGNAIPGPSKVQPQPDSPAQPSNTSSTVRGFIRMYIKTLTSLLDSNLRRHNLYPEYWTEFRQVVLETTCLRFRINRSQFTEMIASSPNQIKICDPSLNQIKDHFISMVPKCQIPRNPKGAKRGLDGYFKFKAVNLSPELASLVGEGCLPRHEVVKRIWAIIKERNLYDPKNKQFAICDDELFKVIGVKRFRTFEMMKFLKNHFVC